jgi:sulfoxide reductase heme-binding subunit YedZ
METQLHVRGRIPTLQAIEGRNQSGRLDRFLPRVGGWIREKRLRLAVYAVGWFPLTLLLRDFYAGNLTVNPIQALTQRLGKYALYFLVLSLACTPFNTLFKFRQALTIRRTLGLFAFMYASLHFLTFVGLDYTFNLRMLKGAIFEKPFVLVGLGALTILVLMAITSFRWWMKLLGKNWKRLHRLVYLAAGLVIVHYSWSIKGNVLRLQGDVVRPLVFSIVVAFLLVLRIPLVRRWVSSIRGKQ